MNAIVIGGILNGTIEQDNCPSFSYGWVWTFNGKEESCRDYYELVLDGGKKYYRFVSSDRYANCIETLSDIEFKRRKEEYEQNKNN